MSQRYDYESLDWESTLNEGVFAMARDPEAPGCWFGAVSQWLDGGNDRGQEYLALVAYVDTADYFGDETDEWGQAEDMLNEITDPNIYEEFGWYDTYEEAMDAVLDEIGHVYNLFEPGK